MLIRMLTIAAGPEWSAQPGQVVDRPDKEAKALIAGGYAERYQEPEKASNPSEIEPKA